MIGLFEASIKCIAFTVGVHYLVSYDGNLMGGSYMLITVMFCKDLLALTRNDSKATRSPASISRSWHPMPDAMDSSGTAKSETQQTGKTHEK